MVKKSKEYWKDRFSKLENRANTDAKAYIKDVQEQFRVAQNNIQTDIDRWYMRLAVNNEISYSAAKKLLKKNELEEFRWTVEQYIKKGRENAVNQQWIKQLENASAKVHISKLDAMKMSIQQHAELLYTRYGGGVTDFLGKAYQNDYYQMAYEVAKGTGVGVNLHTIDQWKIDTILGQSWAADGADFSSRIWLNKRKLVNELHMELSQSLIRGDAPIKAIENLAKTMNVSMNQAGRIIMTELAAISSKAQQDVYKKLGITKYEIVATLDSVTSKVCQEMDGQVFDAKDYEVGVTAPPFHVWCRSTTIPHFEDNYGERTARGEDGETYYVPNDMKYPEWKKEYIDNVGKKLEQPLIKSGNNDIIDNNKSKDKGMDVMVDRYTPCLVERKTGAVVETEVNNVMSKEVAGLKKQGWKFDWMQPFKKGFEVSQLNLKGDSVIQGLIAFNADHDMGGIHVDIIETAPHNYGSSGMYGGVGARLFAYACKISEENKYDLVYFEAKTALVDYYKEKLGAKQIGKSQRMYIDGKAFDTLIKTYYDKE